MTPERPVHLCSKDTCGFDCHLENNEYVRSMSVRYGDAGSVDGEAVCGCEGHES